MSTPPSLGRYHFQAWARRGIGASVANPDTGTLPDRASLDVQISLQVQGGLTPDPVLPPKVTVQLYGPGDIAGIDPGMVIRTEPRQSTVNFEPNYLCGIEFDAPDYPWLFTPAAPNGDRLHPWLALIALAAGEFALPSIAPNPLPVLSVLTGASLQDLSTSWNWAHVQISGDAGLSDTLANAPGNAISRLLCPRRLDPETSYSAFLVPAFAVGALAGLGQDVSGVTTADPAWTTTTAFPLTLPYYYRFDFNTSDEGDFESLVRALTPRVLPASVGQRPMDVSEPDPGVPSAGGPLGLDGALHSASTQETPWTDPAKTAFQSALQTWINQTSPATDDPAHPNPADPVIAPPIYGQWAAAIRSVDRTAAGWENDLNLDPRNRSAAGMGTQIVQNQRTQLMASAWEQVAGVRKANQMLAQAQLARAASQQLYRQHLLPITAPGTLPPAGGPGATDSPQAAAFRTAASQLFADFQGLPPQPALAPSLDMTALRTTIVSRIDPVTTVPARMNGLLTLAPRLGWAPADPLQPIMAAPSFPQPMYAPLRDLDPDYLLPGVEQVPPDTVGLLETDHAFIESYMVGLNHEMARQLLWNGYPTDQRGSYFRQFWDVSAYVPQAADPTDPAALAELLKDIPAINTWPLPAPLGDHQNRADIVPNNVVLLVRGELFKRYPTAIVYAGKAKLGPDGTRVLDDTDERYPLFRGTLSPDMTFLGFNLSEADAYGGTAASPEGFFFVFQEQPSEPRFGLEPTPDVTPVPHWSELAWTNFAVTTPEFARTEAVVLTPAPSDVIAHSPWREASRVFRTVLENYVIPAFLTPTQQPTGIAIVSDTDNPDDTSNNWGVNAAETAYTLLRLPFRILIHADMMLPAPPILLPRHER